MKFTQLTFNIISTMNIMKYLGFSKKGTERQNEQQSEKKEEQRTGYHFSDKYPREEGETRIYNLIILDESGSMSSIAAQAMDDSERSE